MSSKMVASTTVPLVNIDAQHSLHGTQLNSCVSCPVDCFPKPVSGLCALCKCKVGHSFIFAYLECFAGHSFIFAYLECFADEWQLDCVIVPVGDVASFVSDRVGYSFISFADVHNYSFKDICLPSWAKRKKKSIAGEVRRYTSLWVQEWVHSVHSHFPTQNIQKSAALRHCAFLFILRYRGPFPPAIGRLGSYPPKVRQFSLCRGLYKTPYHFFVVVESNLVLAGGSPAI
jgi:hypothetical protein